MLNEVKHLVNPSDYSLLNKAEHGENHPKPAETLAALPSQFSIF